ncbi:BON domain-containing protein [Crenobacter sp. SG2303]|uniref:BON domain-containing protein n=1 Tax=Crenobacter oryzisoli TaxID=3056844 RepID=A0ABT7XIT7_9NEIS|nr:BON domain-containing protein [Crenobacter sp. SG2303]MDN0073655.1 BON domain-containing protein [Crenobacter sp. SG2303]
MKSFTTRAVFLMALLSPALLTSPLVHAADQVAAAQVSDAELAGKVKAALDSDADLKKLNLKVTSKQGEVTITGTMTDDQQMYNAGVIAEKVSGVKYVINNMTMAQ